MPPTPVSLLERLQQPDPEAAWNRFVELYTPLLYYWTRRLGMDDSESGDLVQDVFVTLLQQLPSFHYQAHKRFRGWLWTVMMNRWREWQRKLDRSPVQVSSPVIEQESRSDEIEELIEKDYQQYLVHRALQLMQTDFQPITWKACWEHVVEGRPAIEVAQELGITVNQVHLSKSRALRRLRQELKGLLD